MAGRRREEMCVLTLAGLPWALRSGEQGCDSVGQETLGAVGRGWEAVRGEGRSARVLCAPPPSVLLLPDERYQVLPHPPARSAPHPRSRSRAINLVPPQLREAFQCVGNLYLAAECLGWSPGFGPKSSCLNVHQKGKQ